MIAFSVVSAGCVPVVYNAGGHKEIIENGENGYLWKTGRELINLTKKIVAEKHLLIEISKKAVSLSKKYGYEEFKKKVRKII